MAVNPSTKWPGRTTAVAPAYPYGSSQDETTPGANDGTPYEKARADDLFGLQQALLKFAAIVPSGNADTAQTSQYVEALLDLAMGGGFFEDTGAADAYLFNIVSGTDRQGPVGYTEGMRVSAVVANTNTGASTVNVNSIGAKSIFYKAAALTAGMLTVGDIAVLIFDVGNDRFNLLITDSLNVDRFSNQTIAGAKTLSDNPTVSNNGPTYSLNELGGSADNKNWDIRATGEKLLFRILNDAKSVQTNLCSIDRTGTTADLWNFLTTQLQHNGNKVITAADSATTSAEGVVELATPAEVKTGTDPARVPPVSSLNAHEGSTKAWIDFNGTGTIAISDSFNVSSIVDNGVGSYAVNWDTDFASADYAFCVSSTQPETFYPSKIGAACSVRTADSSGTLTDSADISAIAIGDQ